MSRGTWDLAECVRRYYLGNNPPQRANLEFMIRLRNKIEHRDHPELDPTLYGEYQAMLMNFEELLASEFGELRRSYFVGQSEGSVKVDSDGLPKPSAIRVGAGRSTAGPRYTRNTFMTSSPRWLMTFTAMRPDLGFAKGREMDLRSDSQASGTISALSDVFRLL